MLSLKQKKILVRQDRVFKFQKLKGLFKVLVNLLQLLKAERYLDHCYCNLTYRQCWLCNLAMFTNRNKILDDVVCNKNSENVLIDIAYRLLFYVKRARNDGLDGDDREWVLDFFKLKFEPAKWLFALLLF